MKQLVTIDKVHKNPDNPRTIKGIKFEKLVQSIKELPKMLEKRPIVVDENMIIQGGNMRYLACIEAGLKQVWVDDMEDWTEEEKRQFIIKDNVSFGEWDFDMLTSHYDALELDKMGVDLDPSMFKVEVDTDSYEESIDTKFNDYTIYFGNEEEMDIWYAFLKKLKNKFSDYENVSERVLKYISEVYGENNMKESEMILKFIQIETDGDKK